MNDTLRPNDATLSLSQLPRVDHFDRSLPSTLDKFAALAAGLCGAPMALITVLDAQQQILGSVGLPSTATAAALSLCDLTLQQAEPVIIADIVHDPRVAQHRLIGAPSLCFFIGLPLHDAAEKFGVLCVMADAPHCLNAAQQSALQLLSEQVVAYLALRRHNQQLLASDARYHTLFEYAQVGIVLADANSYYLDANASACQMFGYTREEFIGLHAANIVVAAEVPQIDVALDEIHGNSNHFREWQFRRKDGTVFPAEVRATKMPDGTLLGTIRDISERKKSSEYRQYLSAIVESSQDAIVSTTLDGKITSWNAGAQSLYGYSVADMLGAPIARLLPAELKSEDAALLARLRSGERIAPFATSLLTQHGQLLDVSVTASAIKDATGSIVGAARIVRDITALKQHEREVARLGRLYAALSQVNQAIVWTPNREQLFPKICQVLTEFGGFGMAWIGWHDAATQRLVPLAASGNDNGYLKNIGVYVDDRPPGRVPSSAAFITNRPYICNDMLNDVALQPWRDNIQSLGFRSCAALPIRVKGEVRGTLTVSSDQPDFFQDKEVALLVEAAMDVSFALDNFISDEELKTAQDTLRKNEARLQLVVQAARLGYWELDPLTDNTYCSELHRQIFGYTHEAPPWNFALFLSHVHPDDRVRVENLVRTARASKSDWSFECRIIRRDQALRWISVVGSFFRNHLNEPERVLGTCEDITENKRWIEQSNQAQKMEALGTLAGGIAHDFNNIIGVIVGNTHLAKLDLEPTHAAWQSVTEIEKISQRAKHLIQRILTFSRQQALERHTMSLVAVIDEAVGLLRSTLPASVELVTALAPDVANIHGDATQMQQVLINLCTNAWHALQGHSGQIKLTLENVDLTDVDAESASNVKPGRYVRLTVQDNGAGMDEITLKRIFEPFFTTKPVGQGTGLGLASVHGVVQAHEGAIKVESQLGRGTTFYVYLPAVDAMPDEVPHTDKVGAARGQGEHILYLDDEAPLVLLAKRALQRLGYRVTGFTHPAECLAAFRAAPDHFDLVITDFNMPGASGLQIAQAILAIRPTVPVILSSGYITEELQDNARRLGIRQIVYKPNTVDELAVIISRCMHGKHDA